MEDKFQRAVITDLADPERFETLFTFRVHLGSGSDGEVSGYQHLSTRRVIAVKLPHHDRIWTSEAIKDEAKVHLDLAKYEAMYGSPYGIPEVMVWKLFKDIILALDFLHNKCGFIHRDVKSDNILVTRPPGCYSSLIPTAPIFKLCDFSRAVAFPSTDGKVYTWAGTTDYAPPLTERHIDEAARPAGDMWSLGATLQEFALGIRPVQSRKAFVAQMDKCQGPHPELEGDEELWAQQVWRDKFSAAYRPLNISEVMLLELWDVGAPMSQSYKPFSDELNEWYKKLWEVNRKLRVTSASLVKDLVPLIDGYIGAENVETKRHADSVVVTQNATLSPTPRRVAVFEDAGNRPRIVAGMRKPRKPDQAPSYEGNDYPPLSSEYVYLGAQLYGETIVQ